MKSSRFYSLTQTTSLFKILFKKGEVPLFVVQHDYCDPYLLDKNPSHKKGLKFHNNEFEAAKVILFANINDHSSIKFAQLQVLKHWKKTILHSYYLKLLQIRERIFSTLG